MNYHIIIKRKIKGALVMDCYINLHADKIPGQWYNILADLPGEIPEERESGNNPHSKELMQKIRIKELLKQDVSKERMVKIPEEVMEKYLAAGRPVPLMRAWELERYLGTKANIYIKREDLLPTHSFKLNSAFAQAYYAKEQGITELVSESGAGQWGLALSYACKVFGIKCRFFWVKSSMVQKAARADWCRLFGAEITASPSNITNTGREILKKDPGCPGSLGISIGEAVEYVSLHKDCAYVSGSNLPHVLMHQTIIGQEVKAQLKSIGVKPDLFIACCGGGSNLGGFMGPFFFDKEFNQGTRFLAAESDAAPRLVQGKYRYDSADPLGITPQNISYTLGRDFVPPLNHAGGLRQHNGSPVIGLLRHKGLLDAEAFSQEEALKAGKLFSMLYGVLPAPESSHALRAAINKALDAKKTHKKTEIVLCLSGNGILDINAYRNI